MLYPAMLSGTTHLVRVAAYRLEVTPIWTGLIANTAFWGAAWYGVMHMPGTARRRYVTWIEGNRAANGLCRSCRYSLVGVESVRCAECGRDVPSKA
jgi:hypothetical protein